jgi:hypothetical protein
VNRRLGLHSFLLLFLWASVACSMKPAGENAEASAASQILGSKQVTLPTGTAVTVRLSSAVGSKLSAKGGHFSAIVVRPVEVNGKVVVPAGAEALRLRRQKLVLRLLALNDPFVVVGPIRFLEGIGLFFERLPGVTRAASRDSQCLSIRDEEVLDDFGLLKIH